MAQHYSLIIVGGGPIGLACGLAAKKAGIDYLILEKGCLTNSLFNYPLNMTFFSTSERLEIGGIPFVSNNVKPTRPEALEYYRRVTISNQLSVHLQEAVTNVERQGDRYLVASSKAEYTATHLIVATGFYDIPLYCGFPGEELPKVVHYYKEAHFYAMQKVVVVGASNSAVDAALECWRKGADVTMVVRKEKIGDRVKYWVKPDIENRIKEGSIKVYFNSQIKAARPTEIDIQTPYGVETIANDYVIALTGYRPNFDFLRKLGIQLSDDGLLQPTYNNDTMETNLPNVYLAGVVCGGMNTHVWFIENSREHADKIIKAIVDKTVTPV
ncbi:YpdA family putative bacillithiol disulfide reductase [Paraflavitalea sp. CAU 1676]|uniref:YpdA family putative bacillithiol disulfide reductase n=1 Tax=Paraflavitalea sp. CAU 1676 TaxID=3032598 RepID=UPI0023DA604F|nr:YpdA family putative bacillithiol disulfide reductase [Paraflavitalea sp. CAU 1676]MDF2192495.1 YpdA family putative bacillithiol disulfide reductase [Paraflavitalea sp. CAU 1676]